MEALIIVGMFAFPSLLGAVIRKLVFGRDFK